jgi:hypothetical protein
MRPVRNGSVTACRSSSGRGSTRMLSHHRAATTVEAAIAPRRRRPAARVNAVFPVLLREWRGFFVWAAGKSAITE